MKSKNARFSEEEKQRIKDAVEKAEKKTSGEITTAIIAESSDYAFYEIFVSLILGAIVFTLQLLFFPAIESCLKSLFWEYQDWYVTAVMGFSSFLSISLFYILTNIPAIDRLIIPDSEKIKRVHNRAVRHFVESGVYDTRDRTGILIFISRMERKVVLLADAGINEKIYQDTWDLIVNKITRGLRTGHACDALVEAIGDCGDLLIDHFPIKSDDENELGDSIQELED